MNGSPLYRLYQRSIQAYQKGLPSGSRFARWYETWIRWAAIALTSWSGFTFPERKTGGWWWIWRWRFEALMGWYELELAEFCRQSIQPGATVIDVGGNIGLYSRFFSRLAGPKGRVFVFEPNPENVEVIRRNTRGAGYRNVEVVWSAVSDRDGTAALHISPGHSNHSLIAGYTQAVATVEVPTVKIDTFLRERGIDRVDFIKTDTEGADFLAIEGMRGTIGRLPELIMLVEYNPGGMKLGGMNPANLAPLLESLGFAVRAMRPDWTVVDPAVLDDKEHANLLCVRRRNP
jgi:FkbM family methyltransferase